MKNKTKITILDDDRSDCRFLELDLNELGYAQVKSYFYPEELMEELPKLSAEGNLPDLIIMDTEIYEVFGFDLCKQIRQEDYGSEIAIIGRSWSGGYVKDWINAGADCFLDKGSKTEELGAKIEEVIKKRKA